MSNSILPGAFSLETRREAFRLAGAIADLIYAAGVSEDAAALALASAIQSIADALAADPSVLLDEAMNAYETGTACVTEDDVSDMIGTGACALTSLLIH